MENFDSDIKDIEKIDLNKEMELPERGDLPSSAEVKLAEIKFAATREELAKGFLEKMSNGEDLYANEQLASIACRIVSRAYCGETMMCVKWQRSMMKASTTRVLNADMQEWGKDMEGEIEFGKVVQYSDGSFCVLSNHLLVMAYLRALCEFFMDSLENKGYVLNSLDRDTRERLQRSYNAQGNTTYEDEQQMSKEDRIRLFFGASHPGGQYQPSNGNGFYFWIEWGSKGFEDIVKQIDYYSQYEAYAAGVPLEDIFA